MNRYKVTIEFNDGVYDQVAVLDTYAQAYNYAYDRLEPGGVDVRTDDVERGLLASFRGQDGSAWIEVSA